MGQLKKHTESHGLDFFSTAFDIESVKYLESINTGMYKVASFDVVNKLLLREIAKTEKPIIMSVGMADLDEIKEAYDIIYANSNKIAMLHCVSAYPSKEMDANLSAINVLQDEFNDCIIGQSDHTAGIKVPLYAVALGAQVIEKHYKVDEDMDCIDAPVSISEPQMKKMVKEIREIEAILGDGVKRLKEVEEGVINFRRFSE